MIPGTDLPGRCPKCGLAPEPYQGHRSQVDGVDTGCPDSGPLGSLLGDRAKSDAFQQLDLADYRDENKLLRSSIIALGKSKLEFTPDDLPPAIREATNPNRRGRMF